MTQTHDALVSEWQRSQVPLRQRLSPEMRSRAKARAAYPIRS